MKRLTVSIIVALLASSVLADAAPGRVSLKVRLDEGPAYLILASEAAAKDYAKAIAIAKQLHPRASSATFSIADLAAARETLSTKPPHYVLLFLKPDELDVNFAWQWLALCTELQGGSLPSVCTGIITGATSEDAAAFMQRISDAVHANVTLPARFVDNLGPNPQAGATDFETAPGNFLVPVLAQGIDATMISHGSQALTDQRLDAMLGAGLVHFGGHGHPDRIDDGLRGSQAARMPLSPCVAFNGACYTGATRRWFDQFNPTGKVQEKVVDVADSFCLNFLRTHALAYFAALHPDHGMPVYQEMEYLAYTGDSLGHVMKQTYNGVVLGAGGKLPRFESLRPGMPMPNWSPTEMMLKGTASRVLFGDPAMVVTDALTAPPFRIVVQADGPSARITATLINPLLKSTYTDTYCSDLSADKTSFNDRALIVAELPADWQSIKGVTVLNVMAGGKMLEHRLRGYAFDASTHRSYAQVDMPSDGFMQSPFRVAGASVELKVEH